MKKNVLLFTFIFAVNLVKSQVSVTLDTGNVRALIPSSPLLFWDLTNSVFQVPKSGNKGTVFNSTPWIGGYNNSNLYLAAETYRQNGADYQSGPISTVYSNLSKWDVVKISAATINQYKTDTSLWANPPAEFLKWPAHGDTANGQAFHLAPFVNVGGNPSIYEPEFGDYPLIKGDQCTYYIFNDDRMHGETGGLKMKVEIHRMAYVVADPADYLNNSVFVSYKIYNRSGAQFDSTIFSVYSDFDLGNYADDYIGSDSALNMVYAYNGLPSDDGAKGYGLNPPVEGMILLSHPLSSAMTYNNDNSNYGNPVNTNQYFGYMNARWRNNAEMTYGDSGISGTSRAWYAFSGNICDSTGWTEGSSGMIPGDRRMLSNINLGSITGDASFTIDFAYLFYRGTNGTSDAICNLKQQAGSLKNYYTLHLNLEEVNLKKEYLTIFPNPSDGLFQINTAEKLKSLEIMDCTGKIIYVEKDFSGTKEIKGLSPGVYLINATGNDGFDCRKIVVY